MNSRIFLNFDEKLYEYGERAQNFTYPRRAQLLTHPEMTAGPKRQNLLDFTNVAIYNPVTGRMVLGDPDVRQYHVVTGQTDVSLYPEIEEWYFSLYEETAPVGQSLTDTKKYYADATMGSKACFNKHSWDDGWRSVILQENMQNESLRAQPTIFRGWTIEVLRAPFLVGNVEKQWRVAFRVLNINRPQDFLNMRYSDPRNRIYMGPMINWRVESRTVRGAKPSNPIGRGEPFPGNAPHILISNKDEAQIELSEIRWLSDDSIPNPYWSET